MNTKETLRSYLMRKLHDMESHREGTGRVPTHVLLQEYHDAIMDDMRAELAELADEGLVEMGPTLNSLYLRLSLEGAV